AQWDGQTVGPVLCTYDTGLPGVGYGTSGINLVLTANQLGSVQIAPVGGGRGGEIGINGVNINSPSAAFSLGDGSANVLYFIGRPAGGTHDWVNDSSAAAVIHPNVQWNAGGGTTYTLEFDGTGNWLVTNSLANANAAGILIEKSGTGTMFWNGPSIAGAAPDAAITSPVLINSGALVMQWNGAEISPLSFVNDGLMDYAAPGESQTYDGAISGAGTNEVDSGTLTLKGENSYTGPTLLDGGELIASAAETSGVQGPLGESGVITFAGGTLGWSVNNTFDYSPRFDASPGQQYSLDTGGQIVTLATNLVSVGATLTKLGAGTLTLTGTNTYSGLTTVDAGELVIQGSAGNGGIVVDNGAALGVYEGGSQIAPAALTVGTTSSGTLEFNNVTNTTTPPLLAAGGVSAGGPITINVNSGTFTLGQSYPLLEWTTGSAPPVSLGQVVGAVGTLSTNGNMIDLTITAYAYVWTGSVNGDWDATTANWLYNGTAAAFADGNPVVFNDNAAGTPNVTLNAAVSPSSVVVENSKLQYSIASSGTNLIGGTGGLTKNGNNLLTLSGGVNNYTGATTINGGVVSVGALADGGSPSDIGAAANSAANLVLNGGALEYTGTGATSDHLFTLGVGGGTIDDEGTSVNLDNSGPIALSASGARALTLTGINISGDTLAAAIGDNGGPTALNKFGTGTWILTGTNSFSGVTTIENGVLEVGNGGNGSLGSGSVVDDTALVFDTPNTETVADISGLGSVTNDGPGVIILEGNNTYQGFTTINAGTVQIGNGGPTGQINPNAGNAVVDNGTLVFDSSGTCILGGFGNEIEGTGNVAVEGGGTFEAFGPNTYTGWTYIGPNSVFQPSRGNSGALTSSVCTNDGELLLVRQDNGVFITSTPIVGTGFVWKDINNDLPGDVTFLGTNTYTGGTYINGGVIILGDNTTPGAGSIVGNVVMMYNAVNTTGSTFTFNRPDTNTFPGIISGYGNLLDEGSGTLILTGNNTYTNSLTEINTGSTIQVGDGGTTGSISVDNVTNGGFLVFDLSINVNAGNYIYGPGSVEQEGTGTLTLSHTNDYTGATIVQNGTLVISGQTSPGGVSVGGDLDVYGGTLISGGANAVVSNSVAGNMNVTNGILVVNVNESLAQSNTLYVVTGSPNVTGGGAVTVVNAGPAIQPGDTFTVFNKAVANGNLLNVTGGGVTWQNNLASNGTITALPAGVSAAKFGQISVSGTTLTISAASGTPNGQYTLEEATNLASPVWTPVFTNSFNGAGGINLSTNVVQPGVPHEFYRLTQP
ncbi:MAG: beta strand repeat-containing protein, partial [Limisphaerales bacterium]